MQKGQKRPKKIISNQSFPIVGIGASAGGLEAYKLFLAEIAPDSGMAFILVQHLHPAHTSSLPEILQRETSVPVDEINNNVTIQPNHIYVIPVNKMLTAVDDVLHLNDRPADKKNMLIDVFLTSLAEVHREKAIGIILSGTGTDGTAGLKKIKDYGGITMAQEPDSAAYDDMPQSAMKSEVVDVVLRPEDMPKRLLEIVRTFDTFNEAGNNEKQEKPEEESFRQILALVRLRYGADFNLYKQTTIRRRILRRLVIRNIVKVADYLKFLQQDKAEQDTLFYDLLIPVTAFFRDPKTFEDLVENVFPRLIKGKSFADPIRIWIAGCSTGEEAYSLGISLYEYLSDKIAALKVQIFATDVSEHAIAKARSGIYTARQLEGVSEQRVQHFFTKTDGHFQIKKIIRDMCVFATHNFLKDPPFAKIDLISCRNVLIYMEPVLQKRVFSIFSYALNERGFLLLGKSETTGNSSDLFQQSDSKEKLYTKKIVTARLINVASQTREETLKDRDYSLRKKDRNKDDFQKDADDILLTDYTPPGVIVNEHLDIVQFRGSTGPYLEAPSGKPSLNILRMAKEGISFELRNALHKAKTTGKPLVKEGISIRPGNKTVTIEVIPLLKTIEPHFLILFKSYSESHSQQKMPALSKKKQGDIIEDTKDKRIIQLEKDLNQVREDMRTIAEDQEAANEELQSANEELLSSSEELQSLNEELETGKEELQSTNEELLTVNQELFDRNEQFNRSRIFAETIVSTIHEPLLVLNYNFKIKSANNSFYTTFSLTENETLGKVLFELQNNSWDIPGFREKLVSILHHKEKMLEWEGTFFSPIIGRRTIGFNAQPITEENGKPLILLALNDFTLKKEAEKIKDFHNLIMILESVPQITFSASAEGAFTYFNNYFLEYSGFSLDKALEIGWLPVIHPEQLEMVSKAWEHSIQTLENFNIEFQLKRKRDGMYRWHLCRATAIVSDDGTVIAWVGAAADINDQKANEKAKDDFLTTVAHDLKTPLTTAKAYLNLVEKSMHQKSDPDIIYVKKAHASINTLKNLVSDLKDVSKVKYSIPGLHMAMFNFNSMLSDAAESVQTVSGNHTIVRTGEVKQQIKGDEDRLRQVIVNLLSNAVKFSPGTNKVYVHVEIGDSALNVSVKDDGIGISKKNLNKIFDRYFREKGVLHHLNGLGTGLSVSKEIIQLHHGQIWAESEVGKGSTFYFKLPVN